MDTLECVNIHTKAVDKWVVGGAKALPNFQLEDFLFSLVFVARDKTLSPSLVCAYTWIYTCITI